MTPNRHIATTADQVKSQDLENKLEIKLSSTNAL